MTPETRNRVAPNRSRFVVSSLASCGLCASGFDLTRFFITGQSLLHQSLTQLPAPIRRLEAVAPCSPRRIDAPNTPKE
jgi:hypothetical protein